MRCEVRSVTLLSDKFLGAARGRGKANLGDVMQMLRQKLYG